MGCSGYIDIHTHIRGTQIPGCIRIVNADLANAAGQLSGLFSVGIHPWKIGWCPQEDFQRLQSHSNNPMLAAIGETGLDTLCQTDFALQESVFDWHIRWSEAIGKPMIIHCVRAYQQLITHRKRAGATMPWIIHGYRSSPQMAQQLVRAGCYISFGPTIFRHPHRLSTIVQAIGLGKVFLETDDTTYSIDAVYSAAARVMDLEPNLLKEQIFANFESIFPQDSNYAANR